MKDTTGYRLFALLILVSVLFVSACTENESDLEDRIAGSENQNSGTGPVKIATKPMTEQYILGEMLALIIEEETGYSTEITKGIGGGTSNIHPAMVSGEFDLYPEYTSSGWVMVLGHSAGETNDEEMFPLLQEEYDQLFDMTWLGLYGFNNTYTIAVRVDVAKEHSLATCSDLSAVAGQLTFGGNPDYLEREDGFQALCETYGYTFKSVMDIDIGLKYQALQSGDIDVTNAFTTDAQLGAGDLVALNDDRNLQVNYYCSFELPVEVDGREERDVAYEYLVSKGLL